MTVAFPCSCGGCPHMTVVFLLLRRPVHWLSAAIVSDFSVTSCACGDSFTFFFLGGRNSSSATTAGHRLTQLRATWIILSSGWWMGRTDTPVSRTSTIWYGSWNGQAMAHKMVRQTHKPCCLLFGQYMNTLSPISSLMPFYHMPASVPSVLSGHSYGLNPRLDSILI